MSSERARTLVDNIASTCTQDTGQDMSSSLGYPHHHDGQGHGHDDEGRKQILKNLMIENEMKPVVSGGGSGTQDEEMRSALGYPDHGDGSDDEGRKRSNMENLQMKKEKKPAPASVPFLRLFHFASGVDYLLLILGTLGSIVHGAVLPAFLYYFGDLINSFGSYQNDPVRMVSEVAKYSLAFVYVGIATLIASWIDVACWMHSAERQATKMRSAYLEAILRQDIGFFDTDVDTGSLVDSISLDTVLVQDAIGEKMGSFIHCMATFVGGFVVGFISYWKIALVMLAVLPAIAFAGGLYAYTLTKLSTQSQNAYGKAGSIAEQALTQIRTVFSFVGESKTLTSYSECLKVTVQLGYKGGMAKGLGIGVTSGIIFCSWALILWYSGILVRRNETNGGKAISAIFAVIIGGMSVGQGMSNVTAFAKGKASLQTIMAIIEKKPKMDCKLTDGTTLFDVKGNIEFHNVAFSYPSRPNIKIFNNFSLHIPSGKTIAIVGGSGSGKSTVVSLIERFYDPIEGEVRLDGVDICMLQLKWLRDQIGLVNQEPALFATSIKENILYGNPGASDEDIEQAAKAANVHGFISQLPEGYETQVGERGVQLSGGQKQRIAIGRAMLKNPKILLLDEATSALDYASEQVVQEALNDLMVGRTTVVVAHRLSTIRNVDTIAVVQKGKIVEMGSHEELMTKGMNGTYAALVTLQEMAMSNDGTILTHESRISNHLADPSAISRSFRGSSSPRLSSGRTLSNRYSSGSERYELDGHKTMVEKGKNKQDGNPRKSVYRRLAKLNSPEWPYAVLGTLGAVLSGFVNPAFALLVSEMISVYYNPDFSQMKADIQKYTLIFVGMGVLAAAVYFIQHYYFGIVGENLTGRVREMMLEAILKNEVGWFDMDENSSARLGARLSTDATNVRGAIGDLVALLVQSSSAFLTAIVIGLVLEWRLALVLLATFPLLVGAALAQQFLLKGFAGDLEVVHSRATRVAGEVVVNIRTVAAFNAESQVLHLFASELSSLQNQSFLRGNIAGVGFGIAQFCMFSSYGLALWYGSTLVKSGISEFGPIIKVFFVLVVSAFSVAEALGLAPDFAKGGQALESVFSIIDRKTLIDPDDKDENVTAMQSIEGDIEFHHVEFAYPTRPEVILFKDFNLKVKAGQSVALVGASGSGKSSVISLIERFYDPIAGRVLIDGIDIKKLHLKSLRLHIGLVQQEPALFNESIYSNIVYGREGASQAEVERAAKAANAHGFISGLEEGYRTLVGERGSQLSGGQKQRIAIARAILKEPSILLLDEATSALDAASEKVVQEALGAVMKGRTSVVVAHQLSTVRNASVIAVVQEGKIIEMGSHSELMNIPHGSYARLLNLQSRNHHPV